MKDYRGLLDYVSSAQDMEVTGQSLIGDYFTKVQGTSFNLLNEIEASFGQCLGEAATPYLNLDGSAVKGYWSTPSFVHKSGGWGSVDNGYQNVCFSHHIARQRYYVGASILNACQYHPLGSYWRGLFCDAVARLGIGGLKDIDAFCSDACYYLGQGSRCNGQVNATTTYP